MKIRLSLLVLCVLVMPNSVWAADAVTVSPSGGVLKMVLGLTLVLAVMALITWILKRMMPGGGSSQQSVARIVGGVSVGSRERVVVVEIANRWIVVGVAPGQVNGIANLDIGSVQLTENLLNTGNKLSPGLDTFTQPFAQWLKKSTAKFTEKSDAKD